MATELAGEALKYIVDKLVSGAYKKFMTLQDLKSNIKKLQETKASIEAVLLDADTMELNHSQKHVLEKLSDALDMLTDFLDARAAKDKQKQLMPGNKFIKDTRLFFSSSNQLATTYRDDQKLKAITKVLQSIITDHAQLSSIISKLREKPAEVQRVGTGSCIVTDQVIGRDGDKESIINMFSDSSVARASLPVIPIVGMGGIGKTTLAQCVINDKRTKKCFDLWIWVSVMQYLDVKDLLLKMLASVTYTHDKPVDCEMDQLERRLIQAIRGKKFLLVLDGVWDQKDSLLRSKWQQIEAFLRNVAAEGSTVLITTRSKTVAKIMGTYDPYELFDLEEDDCWLLFQQVAVTQWHDPGLEMIGKEIAKSLPRVPLVLRNIGSLLAEKYTLKEWHAFRSDQLANFTSYGRDIICTLKLSYDHLDAKLKLCVLYFSLFPKGCEFKSSEMIRLWVALGYVVPRYANQSIEEAGKEYLLCLLNRGFIYGYALNTPSDERFDFYMHNLMHDLVLSVAGFKYQMADPGTREFDERVHHVSYMPNDDSVWNVPSSLFGIKHLESFLLPLLNETPSFFSQVNLNAARNTFMSRFQSLKVLRLHGLGIDTLPKSVGELILLRYLDLSDNPIWKLPSSITRLVNLYLLDVSYCIYIHELPKDIANLVMLRHLMLQGCECLSHLPKGLENRTDLETLDLFVVGEKSSSLRGRSKANLVCGLSSLNRLDNLVGELTIRVDSRSKDIVVEAVAANLNRKRKISNLCIEFRESVTEDEMVLDCLTPNDALKELNIRDYAGKRLPSWMRDQLHCMLPNLTTINLRDCKGCKYLCSFGRLPHLRILKLIGLDNVEYIEKSSSGSSSNNNNIIEEQHFAPLFPSLAYLDLIRMPKLKGLWSVDDTKQVGSQDEDQADQHNLINWIPPFPKLITVYTDMELVIVVITRVLQRVTTPLHITGEGRPVVTPPRQINNYLLDNLKYLEITCMFPLRVIPEEFGHLSSSEMLRLSGELRRIPEWIENLTSLKYIYIEDSSELKALPEQMSSLTNLHSLYMYECSEELMEKCQGPTGEYWPTIQHIPDIRMFPIPS